MIQNVQIILNFSKNKKFKFFRNATAAMFLNIPLTKNTHNLRRQA